MSGSTSQLSLNITPRHAYAPDNFVSHAGVRDLLEQFHASPGQGVFTVGFIVGSKRAGKTHFSIKLAELLAARGLFPRLVEGSDFATLLQQRTEWSKDDVVLVDDAHLYLSLLKPGDSGPFVSFVETLRAAKATLILFSDRELDCYSFDEHVRSRLVPGQVPDLGSPAEEDMDALVRMMGKQHGIKLTDRKVGFILRRVARSVPSVEEYFDRLSHLSKVLGRPIKFPLLSGAV